MYQVKQYNNHVGRRYNTIVIIVDLVVTVHCIQKNTRS